MTTNEDTIHALIARRERLISALSALWPGPAMALSVPARARARSLSADYWICEARLVAALRAAGAAVQSGGRIYQVRRDGVSLEVLDAATDLPVCERVRYARAALMVPPSRRGPCQRPGDN